MKSKETNDDGWEEFEAFNLLCRQTSRLSDILPYLSDAIFLQAFLANGQCTKRHKFGVIGWIISIVLRDGTPHRLSFKNSIHSLENNVWLFNYISTPAHTESLSPVFQQVLNCAEWMPSTDIWNSMRKPRGFFSRLFLSACSIFSSIVTLFVLFLFSVKSPALLSRLLRRSSEILELIYEYKFSRSHLIFNNEHINGLFTTYELDSITKAIVSHLREGNKRIVHIMHGQRLPTYQITRATDIILFSKIDESWFRKRVPNNTRLWTIGHPRLEKIHEDVAPPGPRSLRSRPRIAFFSQPAEGSYGRQTRLKDWKILSGLKGQADVRFRLHPRESEEQALFDIAAIGADFVRLSAAGLREDLEWCDAIASSWSTVSMEAAACGRAIFWTCATPERYEASQELRDHGIGALIQDSGQWEPHLLAWREGSWTAPLVVSEQRLRELGMIGDMERPWLERLGLEPSNAGS